MTSSAATQSLPQIVLTIKGQQILSFKNRKRIGKRMLFLDPKYKARMDAIIDSLKSQLLLECQRIEGGISTECLQRFLTACAPVDDCWQVIPEITVKAQKCAKGEEGAIVTITPIL